MGKLIWAAIISTLLIVGLIISNSYDINLKETDGKKEFAVLYGKWLLKSAINVKNIVGYTVKQDWSTNITKNDTKTAD